MNWLSILFGIYLGWHMRSTPIVERYFDTGKQFAENIMATGIDQRKRYLDATNEVVTKKSLEEAPAPQ